VRHLRWPAAGTGRVDDDFRTVFPTGFSVAGRLRDRHGRVAANEGPGRRPASRQAPDMCYASAIVGSMLEHSRTGVVISRGSVARPRVDAAGARRPRIALRSVHGSVALWSGGGRGEVDFNIARGSASDFNDARSTEVAALAVGNTFALRRVRVRDVSLDEMRRRRSGD
jgi:hypothetical protein